MSLIISVSGLRGIIGETLTPQVAMNYAWAFSQMVPDDRPFVITRDGRASGVILADAIHSTLNMSGRSTIDAGIAATPTRGFTAISLLSMKTIYRSFENMNAPLSV